MKFRGLAYDLARNQRGNLAHLKWVVDRLAEFSYNLLTINLENRFEFPSCSGVAPPGALSAIDATQLVQYGRQRGVEVLAQPNLVGHCEALCAVERYAHLSADPFFQEPWGGYEQLNLALPEARRLAKKMLGDVLAAFPGQYIHLGLDEVRRMEYLFSGDRKKQLAAMIEQFRWIVLLARRAGRRVMIWGDMPLKYPELRRHLPRDVLVCDWNYESAGSRASLTRYRDEGFGVLACPAVGSFTSFGVSSPGTFQNMRAMIGDARSLKLDGFLLTTWEFGFGSSFPLVLPWLAMGSALARGDKIITERAFLARFAKQRYGVDGRKFHRLHWLLSAGLEKTFGRGAAFCVRLRKSLFRAADLPAGVRFVPQINQQPWEPSPFQSWLICREILKPALLKRLRCVAREASELSRSLQRQAAQQYRKELIPVCVLADALNVLSDRLESIQLAKDAYHRAAIAQGKDRALFAAHLRSAKRSLRSLRPGIVRLKRIVARLDELVGLDAAERRWLELHEKSLNEHLRAMEGLRFEGEVLLEFGEFLRRPAEFAGVRVTWR